MKKLVALVFVAASWSATAWGQTIESSSESTPFPGVRIVEGRTSGPATDFYAAYVSLCTPGVRIGASEYSGYSTSSSWGNSVGAEVAVNGDFFTSSPRNHVYGDAVGGGTRWASNRSGLDYTGDWYHAKYGWIAFGDQAVEYTNSELVKNRDLSAEGWAPTTPMPAVPPGTASLVSGFPQLVIDGAAVDCPSATDGSCFTDRSDMRQRHPRTAMGLSEDRQTFILVVVDGRSSRSSGMYGLELARLMERLGAHTAINLDGGGSSQMWVKGRGTINRPSDGSPRSVLNHWGIFADGGSAMPAHCENRFDGQLHDLHAQLGAEETDVNGDGRGDACVRTKDGILCSLFGEDGFGPAIAGPGGAAFDDPGWDDPSHYATIRWGDIDGDGLADVCGRNNDRIRCWKSTGDGFGPPIDGPEYGDDVGANHPKYYSTIRLADFDGDGMDDVCMRWSDGMHCHPSTGDGFGPAVVAGALKNDNGWDAPSRYGTIRMGDIDGDGAADLCARNPDEFRCWRFDGTAWGGLVSGPAWSNGGGWDKYRYYSTIQLIDLDGDGRDDVCARAAAGLVCHLSTGDGFGPAISGPALADDSGWRDDSNFQTIRFADVTGDGMLDVCARANAGYRCWAFDGAGFGNRIGTDLLVDDSGWTGERYYRTIDFVDLDRDGRSDLCARAARGIACWRSLGDSFAEAETVLGPEWSDENGFGAERYYSTLRFLGPRRPLPPEPMPETDMGTVGSVDMGGNPGGGGADAGNGGGGGDTGGAAGGDDTGAQSSPDGAMLDGDVVAADGGCGCVTGRGTAPATPGLLVLLGLFARRRRAERRHRA